MSKVQKKHHRTRTHSKVCLITSVAPLFVSESVRPFSRKSKGPEESAKNTYTFFAAIE